jgi:mannose-6-phosphate isomerase-like protein (cupin superfamily)
MTVPISRASALHYVWREVCDGWRLVDHPGISVIEERVPAGASESRHYHKVATQFFYVLEGEAIMKVEGIEYPLSKGTGLEISAGQRHQFLNRSSKEVTFLVISAPSAAGDRFEATT